MDGQMADEQLFALTVDLENDWEFDDPALDHLVLDHLDRFLALLDEFGIPVSVFVVGQTLERYPAHVDRIAETTDAEFHLHSYHHDLSHSVDFEADVHRGMEAFRGHFGRDPIGYRAPQGRITPAQLARLEDLGFAFDSSTIPSYRPGTYNNLSAPLEPHWPGPSGELLELPIGVFRAIRVPTIHSYFKLFGRPLSAYLSIAPLPNVLVYVVHLHDLYRTASHDALDAPKRWIMKRNLDDAESQFRTNLRTILSRGYEPVSMTDLYQRFSPRIESDRERGARPDMSETPSAR